jgi:hypothetical protein
MAWPSLTGDTKNFLLFFFIFSMVSVRSVAKKSLWQFLREEGFGEGVGVEFGDVFGFFA